MEIGEQDLEKFVLLKVMRLNAIIQGIVVGLMVGLAILIATLWLVLKGGPVVGPHLGLLSQFFVGYDVTFLGSLIGFGYGFAFGFSIGYVTAKIYNSLAAWRENQAPAARRPVRRRRLKEPRESQELTAQEQLTRPTPDPLKNSCSTLPMIVAGWKCLSCALRGHLARGPSSRCSGATLSSISPTRMATRWMMPRFMLALSSVIIGLPWA